MTGGHITTIFYGLYEEGIEVVTTRHESATVFAADAYARITGKPGVIMTTAGPGVINTTTGMAEAKMIGSPLIHIGGASQLVQVETGSLQCTDTVSIMSTVSKWARRVYHPERIGEMVTMAFRQATDDTPGPVYLEIAQDVLLGEVEENEFYLPQDSRTTAAPYGNRCV